MITEIKINGFKSFRNFQLDLTPFTVVAGANGSGKSNLFDAFKLLSRLTENIELYKAFTDQRGDVNELFTQYNENERADSMSFEIEMLVSKNIADGWGKRGKLSYTRLNYQLIIKREKDEFGRDVLFVTHESLAPINKSDDKWANTLFKHNDNKESWIPKVHGRPVKYISTSEEERKISLHQDGVGGRKKDYVINHDLKRTILSSIDSVDFPHAFAVNQEIRNWHFMELSPQDLRTPSNYEKWEGDMITQTGKNLAAALFRIKNNDAYSLVEISRRLNQLVSGFSEIDVIDDKANKQYVINIISDDGKRFSSKVLSEGTLRLLALCILLEDEKHNGLLCFEEPENGINPQRISLIMSLLKDLTIDFQDSDVPMRQVIINTHSPLVVSKILKWSQNPCISVWLTEMSTLSETINGARYKLNVSRMNLVELSPDKNLWDGNLNMTKYTLNSVLKYLETVEVEEAKSIVENTQKSL